MKITCRNILRYGMVCCLLSGSFWQGLQAQSAKVELSGNWTFRKEGSKQWLPATVPGYVHTDLLKAGLIDSLYWSTNAAKYDFVGDTGWVYRTRVVLNPKQLAYANKTLVFHGLDTYADVFVNGQPVLRTDNMFLAYRAEIGHLLKAGENTLEVIFKSPVKELKKEIAAYPLFYSEAHAKADRNNLRKFARKAQYQFGWDWACRLVTTGIYMPVELLFWNQARITDVFVKQESIVGKSAELNAEVELQSTADAVQNIVVAVNGKDVAKKTVTLSKGSNKLSIPFSITNPKLWWPNGLGDQPLYNITVKLQSGASAIKSFTRKVGLRKLEFVNEFDEHGRSYYFKVNDVPVFAKGANWVPLDMMLPSVTPARYREMLQQMVDANMNMIRVWGGGIYEYDAFYDLCDEMGILIYQDFMFASSIPPVDSSFLKRVEEEAAYQVKRLRNRPSLALWAGGNENESAYQENFLPKAYPKEIFTVDYKRLFDSLLPAAVTKYNPEISYVRNSPTTGIDSIRANKKGYGDAHAWGVWFGKSDFDKAKTGRLTRFISEYGFVGYPAYTSMQKYIPPSEMDTSLAAFQFHDAYKGIQEVMRHFIDRYYPQPRNLQEFVYISGLLQAEAMEMSNEIYRRNMPYCMGALLWQLNDVWPVASWAMVDYYGQWKPIMYRTRDNFAPVALSVDREKDSLKIFSVNDKLTDVNGNLQLRLVDFNGKVLSQHVLPVVLKSNSASVVYAGAASKILGTHDPSGVMLVARLMAGEKIIAQKFHYFVRNKDLKLPAPDVKTEIVTVANKTAVKVSAGRLAKALYLIDAEGSLHFSDNYFDLPGGETRIIFIKENITNEQLKKRLTVFTLNEVAQGKADGEKALGHEAKPVRPSIITSTTN